MTRILVIEEEPTLRRRFRRDLESEGYQVVSTASCRDGLDLLDRASPDLVVLDPREADMDGLEALEKMIDRCPRVPVLCADEPGPSSGGELRRKADGVVRRSLNTSELRMSIRGLLAPDSV